MRVAVLSDTHSPRFWKGCPPAVASHLAGADLILHAGDVCTADVLDELAAYAPVRVVLGNNDRPEVAAWGAPETLELELAGSGWRWSTTADRPPVGWLGCDDGFPARTSWSSGTPTSRWT